MKKLFLTAALWASLSTLALSTSPPHPSDCYQLDESAAIEACFKNTEIQKIVNESGLSRKLVEDALAGDPQSKNTLAITMITQTYSIDPDILASVEKMDIDAQIELFTSLPLDDFELGQYTEMLIESNADSANAEQQAIIAMLLSHSSKYTNAIHWLEKSLEQHYDAELLSELGRYYYLNDDYENAKNWL